MAAQAREIERKKRARSILDSKTAVKGKHFIRLCLSFYAPDMRRGIAFSIRADTGRVVCYDSRRHMAAGTLNKLHAQISFFEKVAFKAGDFDGVHRCSFKTVMGIMAAGALKEFAVLGGNPFIILLLRLDQTILGFNNHTVIARMAGLADACRFVNYDRSGRRRVARTDVIAPGPWHDSQPVYGKCSVCCQAA
jgi:hypothetical protein